MSLQERRSMVRKGKADLQGPVLICRPARSICRILEGIDREKKHLVAGQAVILRKLRQYTH